MKTTGASSDKDGTCDICGGRRGSNGPKHDACSKVRQAAHAKDHREPAKRTAPKSLERHIMASIRQRDAQ